MKVVDRRSESKTLNPLGATMTTPTDLHRLLSLAFILLLFATPSVYADLEVFASFEKQSEIAAIKPSPGVRIASSQRFPAWAGNSLRLPCGRVRRLPGSTRDYCRVGTASGSDSEEAVMSHFHRRQILQSGVVALANYVIGAPLSNEAQAETRRGIFDAHLHIPSDNGENFQWNLVTRNMPEFVAYLDKCGVRRGVISSSWSNKAQTPEDYRSGN